ncbi:hypothetical protein ABID60_007019 [Bradyrhizobium sp. S3.5.5]
MASISIVSGRRPKPARTRPCAQTTPPPHSDSADAEITHRRPVSGAVSGKLAATPSDIRKFRVRELRAAADRLVQRAEVLRAEAERLLKIAEREEANLARKPRRKPRSAAARPAKPLLRRG